MAKGNWKPSVIKPKTRCRICGRVIKEDKVFIDGIFPAHGGCAIHNRREDTRTFTPRKTIIEEFEEEYFEKEKPPRKTEIELTDSVSIFVD
jgi:hypothetical protein